MQPDVIVRGKLSAFGAGVDATVSQPEPGTLEIALCGYGSQVPRIPSEASIALITSSVQANPVTDPNAGSFEFALFSNYIIQPPGTYYTITVRDANGDIAQINAYEFDPGEYELFNLTPFDPNLPPPPLPTPVTDQLLEVPYSETPDFPGDTYTSWMITLAGDASATFTNLVDGNLYTIIIVQDATGNHNFDWPDNVFNSTAIDNDPNSMTIQTFVAVSEELYPIGAGTFQ